MAKWQVPDQWAIVPEVPKTSVGNFAKRTLRAVASEGQLTIIRSTS